MFHPYKESQNLAQESGVILIPAAEVRVLVEEELRAIVVSAIFGSHRARAEILVYGVTEPIPDNQLSIQKVITEIHRQGGLAIIAHPSGHPGINWYSDLGIRLIKDLDIDGIEALNASIPQFMNNEAEKFAERLSLPVTGGSDTRILADIGKGLTVFSPEIKITNWQDCLKAIKLRETSLKGSSLLEEPLSFLGEIFS